MYWGRQAAVWAEPAWSPRGAGWVKKDNSKILATYFLVGGFRLSTVESCLAVGPALVAKYFDHLPAGGGLPRQQADVPPPAGKQSKCFARI